MIFKKTRAAYAAGYRAGLAGASHTSCFYTNWEVLQTFAWYEGWQTGMRNRLL